MSHERKHRDWNEQVALESHWPWSLADVLVADSSAGNKDFTASNELLAAGHGVMIRRPMVGSRRCVGIKSRCKCFLRTISVSRHPLRHLGMEKLLFAPDCRPTISRVMERWEAGKTVKSLIILY
jgi:hypothetical protein